MRTTCAYRRETGALGERLALAHLEAEGMRVVDRNWRCARGEIDIVAVDGDTLVVVEVKARRDTRFGTPVEQVTATKLRRLRMLTGAWIAAHAQVPECAGIRSVRVDIIGVGDPDGATPRIEHLRAVL